MKKYTQPKMETIWLQMKQVLAASESFTSDSDEQYNEQNWSGSDSWTN